MENDITFDEKRILASQEFQNLNDLLVPSKVYIWWLDCYGKIVKVCDNAAAITGETPSQLVGRLDSEVFSSETFEELRNQEASICEHRRLVSDNLVRFIGDVPRVSPGANFGVYWSVSSRFWKQESTSNRSIYGIVRVAKDVTSVVSSISNTFDESYSDLLSEFEQNSPYDTKDRRSHSPSIAYTHDMGGKFSVNGRRDDGVIWHQRTVSSENKHQGCALTETLEKDWQEHQRFLRRRES